MEVNWQELAERVENTTEAEPLLGTRFPTFPPMRALEIMLGEDFFKSAVDQCIDGKPEAEFAQDILVLVRSSIAMKHCYSIYKESEDLNRRIEALGLIRWIANERVIEWIPEFLDSPDYDVQCCAVAIIDQMLFKNIIDYDDLQPILENALQQHRGEYIRERIQSFIDAESIDAENHCSAP